MIAVLLTIMAVFVLAVVGREMHQHHRQQVVRGAVLDHGDGIVDAVCRPTPIRLIETDPDVARDYLKTEAAAIAREDREAVRAVTPPSSWARRGRNPSLQWKPPAAVPLTARRAQDPTRAGATVPDMAAPARRHPRRITVVLNNAWRSGWSA